MGGSVAAGFAVQNFTAPADAGLHISPTPHTPTGGGALAPVPPTGGTAGAEPTPAAPGGGRLGALAAPVPARPGCGKFGTLAAPAAPDGCGKAGALAEPRATPPLVPAEPGSAATVPGGGGAQPMHSAEPIASHGNQPVLMPPGQAHFT